MSESGRAIACPYCSTGYFLPVELMGAAGARVRCPNCTRTFVVGAREGDTVIPEGAAGPGDAPRASAPPADPQPAPEPERPPASPETQAKHVERAPAAAAPPPQATSPEHKGRDLAATLLDALADQKGESLEHSAREGRLFAEHGREIMETFDAWRRQAGRDADPAVFRTALFERWGVELESGAE